jgi:EAL domain-containing protein (putative c-di-GMP-specific phosphodiesterase class I)
VLDALQQAGVTPDRLALEVNIPALVEPDALEGLRRLRRAGVGVTLDAFGRQPVELCVLPDLGASAVKIDRKLAAFTAHPGPRARMVRVLVEMVRGLGLTGIAEGIESREQASAAHALGLEFGQGFYFGKPMETHEALATRG